MLSLSKVVARFRIVSRSPVAKAALTLLMMLAVDSGYPIPDVEFSSAATAARSRIVSAPMSPEPPPPCSAVKSDSEARLASTPVNTLDMVWLGV